MTDRAYWERHAKRYDRSVRFLSRAIPRMLELTTRAVAGRARVLEIAAGTGLVTTAIAGVAGEVVATDYAEAMVEQVKQRVADLRNVRCEQADLYALPYEPASFDAVVAANVLHLVPDLPAALASMRRVLRGDVVLVVPTFCHSETVRSRILSRILSVTGFPGHRRFTARSLRDAIERAGLRVGTVETIAGRIPIGYVDARP